MILWVLDAYRQIQNAICLLFLYKYAFTYFSSAFFCFESFSCIDAKAEVVLKSCTDDI